MADTRAIRATVTGRVQGVGYRFTTQRIGSRLGLVGWVRNERDGTVTLHAQGPGPVVDEFIRAIEIGPPASRVTGVRVNDAEIEPDLSEFSISY